MEIRPASIDALALGRDGKHYTVSAEAGTVARELKEIDPRLELEFHEPPAGKEHLAYFSVNCRHESGKVDLVLRVRWEDCDQRLVEHVRMLNHELRHGRSLADQWDKADDARNRENDYRLEQMIGERVEPLKHAVQREILGVKPRASLYIPRRKAA